MLPMKTYEKTAFVLYHRLLLEFERNEKNKERKKKKKNFDSYITENNLKIISNTLSSILISF